MSQSHFQISSGLFLVRVTLDDTTAPVLPDIVHHVAVIDVSGSMASDLPELRRQLKKKLPRLIGERDTLSIIAFSGLNQCYVVLETEPVATIADLSAVEQAIDRWVRPVGLTGFEQPLQAVRHLISHSSEHCRHCSHHLLDHDARSGECGVARCRCPNAIAWETGAFSVLFMSDGWDNQTPGGEHQIMRALEGVAEVASAVTVIEYGYHADRVMLTRMAERAGGVLLFAEDFDRYQPLFEATMARRSPSSTTRQVEFEGNPVGQFVWTQEEGELRTHGSLCNLVAARHHRRDRNYSVVSLPAHTQEFYYISSWPNGEAWFAGVPKPQLSRVRDDQSDRALYAACSLFSSRMQPEVILPILSKLGDVALIDQFGGCFGKQQYSRFAEAAKEAAFDSGKRCSQGYDPSRVPPPDAFTVVELMELLEEHGARVLLDHAEFSYRRISPKQVDKLDRLTLDEYAEVAALNAEICAAGRDAGKVREIQKKIEALLAGKEEPLRFVAEKRPDGYPITSLTWNEDRPNLSFKIRQEGTVDLTSRLPREFWGSIPNPFPTFQYRDRAVVTDGVVHLDALPVRISEAGARALTERLPQRARSHRIVVGDGWVQGVVYPKELPVLNRRMVLGEQSRCGAPGQRPSARRLFELQYELERARAAQKVYKALRDEVAPRKASPTFEALYGERAADWLREQGFSERTGFSPQRETVSEDYYWGKAMEVKLRSYSSLPSLAEYRKQAAQLAAGKRKSLTPAAELMRPFMEEAEARGVRRVGNEPSQAFLAWITAQAEAAVATARQLLKQVAQLKFTVIVGQIWFEEFGSLEERSLEFDYQGVHLRGTIELKEIMVRC